MGLKTLVMSVVFLVGLQHLSYSQPVQRNWDIPKPIKSLNSSADDFAPVWSSVDSCLVFTSSRTKKAQLYTSTLQDSIFAAPNLHQLSKNSKGTPLSFATFSNKGECITSTFAHYPRQSHLNLSTSTKSQGSWQPLVPWQEMNAADFTSHPTISPSGRTLIFCSSRSGGEGGTDLWISRLQSGIWSAPENLGDVVNSEGNEITPYLKSDDSLYFSSNSLGGKGGFDIFLTQYVAGEWIAPMTLDEINTQWDESDFTLLPNGNAVFASNRSEMRNLDLYMATKLYASELTAATSRFNDAVISANIPSITVKQSTKLSLGTIIPFLVFAQNSTELLPIVDPTTLVSSTAQRDNLKLIAEQLKAYPVLTLTIQSHIQDSLAAQIHLAKERFELLQTYLSERYGVSKERIRFEITFCNSASTMEYNKVDFIPSSELLFEKIPVTTEEVEYAPREFSLTCAHRSATEIKDWSLYAEVGGVRSKLDTGNAARFPFRTKLASSRVLEEGVVPDSISLELNTFYKDAPSTRALTSISVRKQSISKTENYSTSRWFIFPALCGNAWEQQIQMLSNYINDKTPKGSLITVRTVRAKDEIFDSPAQRAAKLLQKLCKRDVKIQANSPIDSFSASAVASAFLQEVIQIELE